MYVEHTIRAGIAYIHKVDHRNGSHNKSQWTIAEKEERNCFDYALESHWYELEHIYWGLHFEDEKVEFLGETAKNESKLRRLFIAKFLDSDKRNKWHGYPADHVQNPQDIPPAEVLNDWLSKKHLRTTTIRKIARGQKCNSL